MSCPHSTQPNASPSQCSQCSHARIRHVVIDTDRHVVKIDGRVVRNADAPAVQFTALQKRKRR